MLTEDLIFEILLDGNFVQNELYRKCGALGRKKYGRGLGKDDFRTTLKRMVKEGFIKETPIGSQTLEYSFNFKFKSFYEREQNRTQIFQVLEENQLKVIDMVPQIFSKARKSKKIEKIKSELFNNITTTILQYLEVEKEAAYLIVEGSRNKTEEKALERRIQNCKKVIRRMSKVLQETDPELAEKFRLIVMYKIRNQRQELKNQKLF